MIELPQNSRRFRITDILVLTVSVAFAAAMANAGLAEWSWYETGLAFVTCQFCISLTHQSYSIFRVNRATEIGELTMDERWGVRVCILLRVLLVTVLSAHYFCRAAESIDINFFGDDGRFYCSSYHKDCHTLALLMTLLLDRRLIRRSTVRSQRTRFQLAVDELGLLLGLVMIIWQAVDRTIFAALIHIAATGIDAARIFQFDHGSSPSRYFAACRNMLIAGAIGSTVALSNIIWFRRWIAEEKNRDCRGTLILLASGLVATVGIGVWIQLIGLPDLSPHVASVSDLPITERMTFASIVVVMAVVLLVLPRIGSDAGKASRLSQPTSPRYGHEWFFMKLTVFVCSIGALQAMASGYSFWRPRTLAQWVQQYAQLVFFAPLLVALALVALTSMWRLRSGVNIGVSDVVKPINISKFAATIVVGFLVVLTSCYLLGWLGFAINVYPYRTWIDP